MVPGNSADRNSAIRDVLWLAHEPMTSEEVAILDENSEYLGVSTLCLMENAGKEVANFVSEKHGNNVKGKRIVVFAGTGNNGGDGFVAARHLAHMGAIVDVILLGSPKEIRTDEAARNYRAMENMVFTIEKHIITDSSELRRVTKLTKEADTIVDAILGTGIKGKLREPAASAIALINSTKTLKVAVDIPSGVNPDTGEVGNLAVRADATVTFHRVKKGLPACQEYTGGLVVKGIGIPVEAEIIVGPGDVRHAVKPRMKHFHKGDFGKILVIGGGDQYSGAPYLSALAALKAGAGLTIIAAPSSVSGVIRKFSPLLIVRELPGKVFSLEAMPIVDELLGWASSIVIGPGLGLNENTKKAFTEVLKRIANKRIPIVLDADGLKLLVENKSIVRDTNTILTPHLGEFKILTGCDISKVDELDKVVSTVLNEAKNLGVTLLVKVVNGLAVISDGRKVKVNLTGNTGMAKGGVGDVLSGITATFFSWTQSALSAGAAGAFVSGKAGDVAFSKVRDSLTPMDMIENIHEVMKPFYTERK
nr:NAD(P)H-hydrate dehydratase [Candidatus Njordarchaeum guaymaensis]